MFYAIVNVIVDGIVKKIWPVDIDEIIDIMEQFGVPQESIDMAMPFIEGSDTFMGMMIGFFIVLLLAAVFSTIGGLIGGAVFKVTPEAEAPPGEPPTTP
jgi:hypothetical protein